MVNLAVMLVQQELCAGGLGVCFGKNRNMRFHSVEGQERSWYKRKLKQEKFQKAKNMFVRSVEYQDPLLIFSIF